MKEKDNSFAIDFPLKKLRSPKINKYNKYLDDYNTYTKNYIKHYKKSTMGDIISLSKYPYLKIKSENVEKKLHKAQIQSALTKKQIKRFIELKMKLVKAIS